MPVIKPSSDLRNHYNEISTICHQYNEPVFITKNGEGDLAVMSMEVYEKLMGRLDLYKLIDEGLEAEKAGRVIPAKEAMKKVRDGVSK